MDGGHRLKDNSSRGQAQKCLFIHQFMSLLQV